MVAIATLDWQDMMAGTFPENPARTAFRAAVATVAERAKAALPESHGRIDAAVKLVLAGDVTMQDDGSAEVGSASDAGQVFHVNGACECPDFQRAPQQQCKHRLSYGIYKRATALAQAAMQALDQPPWPEQAQAQPVLTPAPPAHPQIPSQFLVTIQGKQFVTYAGLLAMAHAKGLQSLSAHFISVTSELALAEATAEFTDGTTWSECADSTPANVGSKVKLHFARMALTRSKARALRDALNISQCSVEELEG